MNFTDKPMPSVETKEVSGGWIVCTYNVAGVSYQEKFFASKAEAQAYHLKQYAVIRAESAE